MTLPDMWKKVKTFWIFGLTPKSRVKSLRKPEH